METQDNTNNVDRTFFRILNKNSKTNDFLFWQSVSPLERLAALEEIRTEYNTWKYGADTRFQRVFKIIKRK